GHVHYVRVDVNRVDYHLGIVLAEEARERTAAKSHDQYPLGFLDKGQRDGYRLGVLVLDVVWVAYFDSAIGVLAATEPECSQPFFALLNGKRCVRCDLCKNRLFFLCRRRKDALSGKCQQHHSGKPHSACHVRLPIDIIMGGAAWRCTWPRPQQRLRQTNSPSTISSFLKGSDQCTV